MKDGITVYLRDIFMTHEISFNSNRKKYPGFLIHDIL